MTTSNQNSSSKKNQEEEEHEVDIDALMARMHSEILNVYKSKDSGAAENNDMNSKSAIAILTEIEEGLTENQKKIKYIMMYERPNKTKPEDKDGMDLVKD